MIPESLPWLFFQILFSSPSSPSACAHLSLREGSLLQPNISSPRGQRRAFFLLSPQEKGHCMACDVILCPQDPNTPVPAFFFSRFFFFPLEQHKPVLLYHWPSHRHQHSGHVSASAPSYCDKRCGRSPLHVNSLPMSRGGQQP